LKAIVAVTSRRKKQISANQVESSIEVAHAGGIGCCSYLLGGASGIEVVVEVKENLRLCAG
jgi:hypothetical protein